MLPASTDSVACLIPNRQIHACGKVCAEMCVHVCFKSKTTKELQLNISIKLEKNVRLDAHSGLLASPYCFG